MDEVIRKPEGQFKDILDEIVDYSKHESKKDPLIKELNRSKVQQKPSASLNSSTYSSAASSLSAASTSSTSSNASTSSSTSISSSSSSSSSSSTSSSSSPKQSNPKDGPPNLQDGYANVEVKELGKTAEILEHHILPASVYLQAADKFSSTINSSNANNSTTQSTNNYGFSLGSNNYVTLAANQSAWKTIDVKRDKRMRRKPMEKKIFAGEIPGNIGKKSVEELENFIKVSISFINAFLFLRFCFKQGRVYEYRYEENDSISFLARA